MGYYGRCNRSFGWQKSAKTRLIILPDANRALQLAERI